MADGPEFSTRSEADDLFDRVQRFRAAWEADRTTDLEPFLPAPPAPHRPRVLVALIQTDMELRARAARPVRAETYLGRFRWELPAADVVLVIATEYRLRHKHGDKPRLAEYRSRFPDQYDALSAGISKAAGESTPRDSRRESRPKPADSGPIIIPPSESDLLPQTPVAGDPRDVLPADVNYKLIRLVGRGAFGQVYEAEAPGGFRVAVKQIIRDVAHPASRGEIEALEAIKAINHPFLLQTQAYWVVRNHIVIVMELADGSLTDRMEFHRSKGLPGVPPEELIPYFEQAGEALDYLHSQNVSHRDVKPQNLLHLKGYAKVADFGLARGHEHTLTNVGGEVGTPVYMAPEVWKQKVSLHSDQYSLAASYVQARLGRPLFATRILHELAIAHTYDTPDLEPLPAAEQKVLLKALAKKPENRYPSCLAFARALREAVLAPPTPRPLPAPPTRWEAVALLLGAALVCGLTLGVIGLLRPPPSPPVVVQQNQQQPREIWCPDPWQPVGDKPVKDSDGREYHPKLTRTVPGTDEQLVAILVPRKRPSDPPSFYMLENKITNKVFAAVWNHMKANPTGTWNRFHEIHGNAVADLLPKAWESGAIDKVTGKQLETKGSQEDVPVVGVTVPEAMLVAEVLGGVLPTFDQWLKATGAMGDDGPPVGPVGAPVKNPNDHKAAAEELENRGLALGRTRPTSVKVRTKDVSYCGIHQLVTNGKEWTGGHSDRERLSLLDVATTVTHVQVVGRGWDLPDVLSYKEMRTQGKLNSPPWTDTSQFASFRIVLEPPR